MAEEINKTYTSNSLYNDSTGVIAFAEQLKQELINWANYQHVTEELGQNRPDLQNELNNLFLSVYERFLTFLNDADASEEAINTWKEIENFLADYTDEKTLASIVAELNNKIESRLTVPLESTTGSSITSTMTQKAITETIDASKTFTTGEKVDNVGIDSEPTAGSDNLVKSGGVEKFLASKSVDYNNPTYEANKVINYDGELVTANGYGVVRPIKLEPGQTIFLNKGNSLYYGTSVSVLFLTDSTGSTATKIYGRDNTPFPLNSSYYGILNYTNNTNADIYVGTSTYDNQRSYLIKTLKKAAAEESLSEYLKINGSPLSNPDARAVTTNIKAASLFNFGYAVLTNADNPASSSAKVISKDGYILDYNTILIVRCYPTNTANSLTLNINNTGALPLYFNGKRAGASNYWTPDGYILLTTNGTEYYAESLDNKQVENIISTYGVTYHNGYNTIIRELYLEGLNPNANYYISTIRKDASPSNIYGLYINPEGSYGIDYAVAMAYINSETKSPIVRLAECHSSGISGYAVVDWSKVPASGYIALANTVQVRNDAASLLEFNSTIYSYLNTNELVSNLGVSAYPKYNQFFRELYLEGLSSSETYYVYNIVKTENSSYYFYIRKRSNSSTVCGCYLSQSAEKTAFVRITQQNSSGISGYAVIDWNALDFGSYTPDINLKNNIISNVSFSPTIYSYLNKLELQTNIGEVDSEVQELKLSSSGNNGWQNVYNLAKDIQTSRPYFLNDSYAAEVSENDTSYLDNKIRNIPDGKHFIFTTDSHIDYYNVGLSQKETQIMLYVKSKLNSGPVIFGGDAIGQQDSVNKAVKVLAVYAEDKFNAFGPEFLWCQGNHDANYNDGQNQLSSKSIYARTAKEMQRFSKAVFDTEGIELINGLSATDEQREKMIAWWNLHYYYDDVQNKVRFIVIETGDGSDGLSTLLSGAAWNGYLAINGYITFIGNALLTCPDGWDVVVVMHMISDPNWISTSAVMSFGIRPYYDLLTMISAFKNRTSVTVYRAGDGEYGSKPFLKSIVESRIPSAGATFNFNNRTSGRIFCISGHYHHDDAWIIQNPDTSSVWNYCGKEYGEWDTLQNNAILHIQLDRAALYDQGASSDKWPNAVSYPNQGTGEGQEERVGTVKEVLFDVITLTQDNKVICTRIGAGSDRIYNLPTQN